MKKNLKIVSAAAAALLAVAPVVATGVAANPAIVNADANNQLDFGGSSAAAVKTDVTLNPTITAISGNDQLHISGSISGTISATYNGQSYQANLPTSTNNAHIYRQDLPEATAPVVKPADLRAGYTYRVEVDKPSFNFGSANANKTLHVAIPKNVYVDVNTNTTSGHTVYHGQTITVRTNQNGVFNLRSMTIRDVKPLDLTNTNAVNFYEKATGNQVQTGNVSVNALNGGRLNVSAVVSAITDKYVAAQVNGSSQPENNATLDDVASEVESALKAAKVTVDNAGWFTAPKSFVVNVAATSNVNGNKSTLPVTVNVPNGKETTNTDEYAHTTRVWNKKASYIYNDKHVRQGNNIMYKIGSGHNVVANADGTAKEYTIAGGVKAYKLADGYYKGDYVDVRNFQTTRVHVNNNHKTAKVRSRVFDVRGKAVKGMYIEKGATVRVYGTKTIKGHKMYKIAKHNRYVKVANF